MMSSLGGKNAEVVSSCSAMVREAVVPLLARAQQAGEIRPDVDVSDLLKMSHAISVACEYPSSHSDQAQRLLTVMLDGLRHGAGPDRLVPTGLVRTVLVRTGGHAPAYAGRNQPRLPGAAPSGAGSSGRCRSVPSGMGLSGSLPSGPVLNSPECSRSGGRFS